MKPANLKNYKFINSSLMNDLTFLDYFNRFKKVALSLFEWVNLPKTMDPRYLEKTLFFDGQASFLYDNKYGFINTRCTSNGYLNIYNLPTSLNCYSFDYHTSRSLYVRIK